MKKSIFAVIVLSCLAQGVQADAMLPGDTTKGKQLHEAGCISCHGSEVYTRKNRRVKSVEGLIGQVHNCNNNLSRSYNDAQLNDLTKFLNETYYKFQ
jgi:cytochrome c553